MANKTHLLYAAYIADICFQLRGFFLDFLTVFNDALSNLFTYFCILIKAYL